MRAVKLKKIIAIVFIILVLAGCIAGLIFLNSEVTITHNVSENTFDIPELKMADSKLLTTAIRTDVEKWIEIEGNVTGPTDEILNTIFIKRITDINALAVKTGDHVLKDDILFNNGKYKYLSPVNGRIANINQQGNNLRVTIVNYDCLYISAQIPQIYIDEAVIGEHVDIEYNEEWVNGIFHMWIIK
jgi:PBP1b-binding outer membrane lipoprotein LpoB